MGVPLEHPPFFVAFNGIILKLLSLLSSFVFFGIFLALRAWSVIGFDYGDFDTLIECGVQGFDTRFALQYGCNAFLNIFA